MVNLENPNTPPLIIIHANIAKQWNQRPQDICVYDTTKLNFPRLLEVLKAGRTDQIKWCREVAWLDADDLFTQDLYFIVDVVRALPGSLQPQGAEQLNFNGKPITPLLPINSKLLEYFSPDTLRKQVQFETAPDNPNQIKVILTLPLAGMAGESPKLYFHDKTYELREENSVTNVPLLEVWPHFQTKGWQEYYTLYYDLGEPNTFTVEFPNLVEERSFKTGNDTYHLTKLSQFPSYIRCREKSAGQRDTGLILLGTPPTVGELDGGTWKVGVNFGTSFTNVYVNRNGAVTILTLDSLHLKVTESEPSLRRVVLLDFFVIDLAAILELPLLNILTTRINSQTQSTGKLTKPFLQGVIFIPPGNHDLHPEEPYIHTGLQWSKETANKDYTKLFLRHLALLITAMAAKSNAKQIDWYLSYPSAFSRKDRNTYSDIWDDLLKSLGRSTGIKHLYQDGGDQRGDSHLRTESLATAQFFADCLNWNMAYSTCVDIGGGTSNISIWERNTLVHQCSIQFAGKHLLTDFLEQNMVLLAEMFPQDVNVDAWSTLDSSKFSAKLDVLLRRYSKAWLRTKRDEFLGDHQAFAGLVQLMSLGFAGLYFYIGTLLKALHQEGKYKRGKVTPVYLAGNGANLLNWLSEGGRFDGNREINGLLGWMLAAGLGVENKRVRVETRMNLKTLGHEVACGLVLDKTKLQGIDADALRDDLPFAGELCLVKGIEIGPEDRLPLADDDLTVDNFIIPTSYDRLRSFLDEFNLAVRSLRLDDFKPIVCSEEDFSDVERVVEVELLDVLHQQSKNIHIEPPFILVLKALLVVLTRKWRRL